MTRAGARRGRLRSALIAALVVAAAGTGAIVVGSGAAAHHPDITASTRCGTGGPLLSWTARSWITYDDPHAYNFDIDVDIRIGSGAWQNIGHGQFVKANNFQFSGTYTLPVGVPAGISVRSIARGPFGPTGQFGSVGESRTTSVRVPQNCTIPGATCGGTLGKAADYNLFVQADASLRTSDVEGRVAVGGHLDAASSGVGRALTPESGRVDLAVGSTIGASDVSVHNGSVNYGSGTVAGVSTPHGVITQANGSWIAAEFGPLTAATQLWAVMPANGQAVYGNPAYKTLTLIGTDLKTNVFSVAANDLASVRQVQVQVPAGATVLVNVAGTKYSTATGPMSAMQFWDGAGYAQFGYPSTDAAAVNYRTQMLWNFYQATDVELGGLSWEGSVLAPYAAVHLSGGQLNGAVIAGSVPPSSGPSTELHPFRATVSCLPPPAGTPSGGGGGGGSPTTTTPPPVVEALCTTFGTVTGAVFEDHNANGKRDGGGTAAATDRGIGGVDVTATDITGAVAGAATTAPDGTYKIVVDHAADKYLQVRFTELPAGYLPGARTVSGSTLQFVRLCDSKVDLALAVPGHYCQDNPDLAASCSFRDRNGSLAVRTQTWGSGWNASTSSFAASTAAEYATGHPDSSGGSTGNPVAVATSAVGSVNGLAWRPSTRTLYAASFVKAGAPIGPGGVGAVYAIPLAADGSATASTVVATLPAAATGQPVLDVAGRPTQFDDAGRTGLGDTVVVPGATPDKDTLYVVGLADRRLYAISHLGGSPSITPIDLPLTLPGATVPCASGDVRPGAITAYGGLVYVGLTCTAESTGDRAQLAAYVYRLQPGVGFDATPMLQFPLTYDRTVVESWTAADGNWQPWSSAAVVQRNQAWLTSLAITEGVGDAPGDLVVGLRSRAGDTDEGHPDGTGDGLLAEGDLLLASRTAAGWAIEPDLSPTAQDEYFVQDSFPWTGTATHYEAGRGSVAAVPGFRNIAAQQLTNWHTGGIAWHTVATGRIDRAMSLYSASASSPRFQGDTFAKANGLGDLVAMCDQAPIQIGDRVWSDANGDGIQQAGELGLKDVRVELRHNGTAVATSTTNGVGAFAFPNVAPRTDYELWIDTAQASVGTTQVSPARVGPDPEVDSNATRRTTAGHTYAVVEVETGAPGSNDFGFDIGFVRPNGVEDPCATSCPVVVDEFVPPPAGPQPTFFIP